jgi:membrane protein
MTAEVFAWSWNLVRWPVIVRLLIIAMALLYYYAPDVQQEWQRITQGSVFAVIAWLLTFLEFCLLCQSCWLV